MMDTPSRGGVVTSSEKVKVQFQNEKVMGNMEGYDMLKSEIVELRKSLTASKQESDKQKKESDDLNKFKTENSELRKILDVYKWKYGLLEEPVQMLTVPQVSSLPNIEEFALAAAGTPKEIIKQDSYMFARNSANLTIASHEQKFGLDLDMEWSFGEIGGKAADMTLRTSLLEKIYDMARSSEEFKMQLVDNLIILLKFKELSVEDSVEKAALQESIDTFTKTRDNLQSHLTADFEDLEKRVTECFAGISEFHAFSKHFREELDEIKRMNEINWNSPNRANFSPLNASSPLTRNGPQKSSLKSNPSSSSIVNGNRVQFKEDNLNESVPVLRQEQSAGPGRDPCKDCSRYRALLKSFQTTQEADRQKHREQEKTIEKLSTAITSTQRHPRLSSVRSEQRMELLRSLDKSDSDLDVSAKRLQFDSPDKKYNADGSGGCYRSKLTIGSVGSGNHSRTKKGTDEWQGSNYAQQGTQDSELENELYTENTLLRVKVSELEQKILKLEYFSPPKDADAEIVSRKLANITHALNQTTLELADLRMKLQRTEEEKSQILVEFTRTNEDLELALEDLERYDIDLKKEKLANESLKQAAQQQGQFLADVTNNTCVSPNISLASNVAPEKYDLWKDYERLRLDFDELASVCEEFRNKNTVLESKLNSLTRNPPSSTEVLELKKELRSANETIVLLRKEAELNATRLKKLNEELKKESPEVDKLRKQSAQQKADLTCLQNEVQKGNLMIKDLEKAVESQRNEIQALKNENRKVQAEIQKGESSYCLEISKKDTQIEKLQTELERMSLKLECLQDEKRILLQTGEDMAKEHEFERKNLRDALLSHDINIKKMEAALATKEELSEVQSVQRFHRPEVSEGRSGVQTSFSSQQSDQHDGFLSKLFGGRKNRKPRRSQTFSSRF